MYEGSPLTAITVEPQASPSERQPNARTCRSRVRRRTWRCNAGRPTTITGPPVARPRQMCQIARESEDTSPAGGAVDELLGVAVERPALEQLEVEVARSPEDR